MNKLVNIGSYIDSIHTYCQLYGLDEDKILSNPVIQDLLNCPPVKVRFPKAKWLLADDDRYWQCSHCGGTIFNGGSPQPPYPHCPYCGREMQCN